MVKPKKFLNDAANSVEEFIDGLLIQYPNHLVKLQNHNVVMAAQRDTSKVQLLCGGGSGHEPSHAGYLGSGMLSAAVCGGMFASPSVSSVLAAIRVTAAAIPKNDDDDRNNKSEPAGILVVIKNYTGDRLNFGMAAEKAGQEGIPIQTVVVADDCALPRTKGITGARGVAVRQEQRKYIWTTYTGTYMAPLHPLTCVFCAWIVSQQIYIFIYTYI